MTCSEVRNAVFEYVACSMPLASINEFYSHLVKCEDCRIHVTCYRKVVCLLQDERAIGPSEEFDGR